MRLADKFTLVRIIYAPFFLISFITASYLKSLSFLNPALAGTALAIFIFITAALILVEITDYLDGKTARKLNEVSETGKILDPFADAMLHITIFFCFAYSRIMPAIIFMLIFYREFGMLFLRLQATKKGQDISARMGGKLKTVLYITTCFWSLALIIYENQLLFKQPLFKIEADFVFPHIRLGLFIVCAAASYISFIEYIYRWTVLSKRAKKS